MLIDSMDVANWPEVRRQIYDPLRKPVVRHVGIRVLNPIEDQVWRPLWLEVADIADSMRMRIEEDVC